MACYPPSRLSIIAVAFGVLAAACLRAVLYIKSSPTPVSIGEGAMTGGLAGVVGGIIYLIIGLPIALLFGAAAMTEQLTRSGVDLPIGGFVLMIISAIIGAIILAVLATLGGLLAVPIFEKRKGNGVPPPPQDFGGNPGNYGTGL